MVLHFEQKNWMFCPEVAILGELAVSLIIKAAPAGEGAGML
jgi:hypothetical protein